MKQLPAVGILASILIVGSISQSQANPIAELIKLLFQHGSKTVPHAAPKVIPHAAPHVVPRAVPPPSVGGVIASGTAKPMVVPGVAAGVVVASLATGGILIKGFSDLAQGVESTIKVLKDVGFQIGPDEPAPKAVLDEINKPIEKDIEKAISSEKDYEAWYCLDKKGQQRVVSSDTEICPFDATTPQKPQLGKIIQFDTQQMRSSNTGSEKREWSSSDIERLMRGR